MEFKLLTDDGKTAFDCECYPGGRCRPNDGSDCGPQECGPYGHCGPDHPQCSPHV